MLRTNTLKCRENIKKYIIKIYDGNQDYSNHGINTETTDYNEIIKNIKDIFNLEVGGWYSKQVGEYNAFEYWCRGLPSIIDTCYFYNRSAKDDVAEILEETEEEKNRYTEDDAGKLLTRLIYKEVFK